MNKAVADLPLAVCLMGPTASGKTALAVELVQRGPFEIISVDSALVYGGMDIGTAKPGPAVLSLAPHRLVNICDPTESYSAARFREDALASMHEIVANGKIPLLVGGTMLYFRALERGLSEMPAADPTVRLHLDQELQAHGSHYLHERLALIDPVSAARIHPNDPQRLQRALEVYELTGKTLTEHWQQANHAQALPYRLKKFAVIPPDRLELRERVAIRFRDMLQAGFIAEVEALRARAGMSVDLASMRAVGYRQVWQYLDGQYGYDDMERLAVTATCQLAKRQLTWLRSDHDLECLGGNSSDNLETLSRALGLI